jgi:hypothetical protein
MDWTEGTMAATEDTISITTTAQVVILKPANAVTPKSSRWLDKRAGPTSGLSASMTQSSLSCYRYGRSFSFCDPPLVRCVEDHGEWRPDLAKQLRIICGIRHIFVANASAGHWDYAATSRMHTPPLDAETTATLRLHIYPLHLEVLRQVDTCPCQLCFGSSCSVLVCSCPTACQYMRRSEGNDALPRNRTELVCSKDTGCFAIRLPATSRLFIADQ